MLFFRFGPEGFSIKLKADIFSILISPEHHCVFNTYKSNTDTVLTSPCVTIDEIQISLINMNDVMNMDFGKGTLQL